MDMKKLIQSVEDNKERFYEEMLNAEDEELRISKIELQPASIELLGNELNNENVLILGRTREGKTIAGQQLVKLFHKEYGKGILIVDGDNKYSRQISSHGGRNITEDDEIIATCESSTLVRLVYSGVQQVEDDKRRMLENLHAAIPSLPKHIQLILIDEAQHLMASHFDIFMDCVRSANKRGIQFITMLQSIENIMSIGQQITIMKEFTHILAFRNYESGLQRVTAELKQNEAVYLQKNRARYSISFVPAET